MDKLNPLLHKYNVPGPRYTSYPTVPHWEQTPSVQQWQKAIKLKTIQTSTEGISLYIHLPYCESMCTYCGCNKILTKNHDLETPYIELVLKEWRLYKNILPANVLIKEIHLGGGTPTFFSAENLKRLIDYILLDAQLSENPELSIEAHPSYTSYEQLEVLRSVGFNRLSLGIQDFDHKVQEAINRPQSVEEVTKVVKWARDLGYRSINFDLIFGLPFQTLESISETVDIVSTMHPDRIAFYSYAHVPWKSKVQRLFSEADLPEGNEKRALYEKGRSLLFAMGYHEVGMDHFALKSDDLFQAFENGEMHRNFMGYTHQKSSLLIGLGVSSISDIGDMYIQNEKSLKTYRERVRSGELPIMRGHILSEEDSVIKKHILNIMCKFRTSFDNLEEKEVFNGYEKRLTEMEKDGLLGLFPNGILISDKGKTFVRNICMALDKRLLSSNPETQLFSSTV